MATKTCSRGSRIPAGEVTLGAQPAILTCEGGPAPGAADSSIVVIPVMDGDVIRKLRIRCGCGRTTEIDCSYGAVTP